MQIGDPIAAEDEFDDQAMMEAELAAELAAEARKAKLMAQRKNQPEVRTKASGRSTPQVPGMKTPQGPVKGVAANVKATPAKKAPGMSVKIPERKTVDLNASNMSGMSD